MKQREVLDLNKKLSLLATQKQGSQGRWLQQPPLISNPLRRKIQTNMKLLETIQTLKPFKRLSQIKLKAKSPEPLKQYHLGLVKQKKPYMASTSLIKYLSGRETFSPILGENLKRPSPATQGLALGVQQN